MLKSQPQETPLQDGEVPIPSVAYAAHAAAIGAADEATTLGPGLAHGLGPGSAHGSAHGVAKVAPKPKVAPKSPHAQKADEGPSLGPPPPPDEGCNCKKSRCLKL